MADPSCETVKTWKKTPQDQERKIEKEKLSEIERVVREWLENGEFDG